MFLLKVEVPLLIQHKLKDIERIQRNEEPQWEHFNNFYVWIIYQESKEADQTEHQTKFLRKVADLSNNSALKNLCNTNVTGVKCHFNIRKLVVNGKMEDHLKDPEVMMQLDQLAGELTHTEVEMP